MCLQNYLHNRYCSIVIPAAYSYAEGCIAITFHFVSSAHIRAYDDMSSAVLMSRPRVPPKHCSYLGLSIDSLSEL